MKNLVKTIKCNVNSNRTVNTRKKRRRTSNIKNIIIQHIINNIREYSIVSIFFLIGIILGVIVINNSAPQTQSDVQGYILSFINSLKSNEYKIDIQGLLQASILNNVKLAILIWFVGSTVIGMPLLYGIIAFRGYCLGYTIAAIMATLQTSKAITFTLSSLLLQNILIVPAILALSVSGIKLHKAIMQDRRKENIKTEIYKHSLFCLIMLIVLIIAGIVETYASGNLIMYIAKYI